MMRYYELQDDMSMRMRHRWHIGRIRFPNGGVAFLELGTPLEDAGPLRADVHHIGIVLDFCHTTYGAPIATKPLADAVRSAAAEDVQILPVMIASQSGMMVLNAVRVIRCVDESRSEFQKFTADDDVRPDLAGQYRHISKLVLDRRTVPLDAHFFRVKDWSICLIVSEVVKDAMERVGCYGAEFTELEMA